MKYCVAEIDAQMRTADDGAEKPGTAQLWQKASGVCRVSGATLCVCRRTDHDAYERILRRGIRDVMEHIFVSWNCYCRCCCCFCCCVTRKYFCFVSRLYDGTMIRRPAEVKWRNAGVDVRLKKTTQY